MKVYELTHLYYRDNGQIINSPKNLGLYRSREAARSAVSYYKTLLGFRDYPSAFSMRERAVSGEVRGLRYGDYR